jgi:cytochrome c biogenesis protein CcmG/thiol:disulfide interchange protein DsbE
MSLAALLGLLGFMLLQEQQISGKMQSGQLVGKPIATLNLTHVTGKKLPITAPFTDQITVLNLFASWCTPCIAELPELAKLYGLKNVQIIGITWHDKQPAVLDWVKKHHAKFDAIYADADFQTGTLLGIRGIPESFIIDHLGVIRYHHSGPIDARLHEREILPLIKELQQNMAAD